MSKSRDNHYVPQWYQREFFEPEKQTLAFLDLQPEQHVLPDGRTVRGRALFSSPTSRCFFQTDLYSTFFGTSVNDEIEKRMFGAIDERGSRAVRAFQQDDRSLWHDHFQDLFEYVDVQKLRTPKGLSWLRSQYPSLSQNELMMEMQGIRNLHCTIWTGGVREIVSAEDSDVKFIVTDHPVTIFNHALPPDAPECVDPQDPSIALKGSQTIFPLGRDHCLILTNLEYAQDQNAPPLEKRTFARNYRQSMVNTINFIRTRKLLSNEVASVNMILKWRARRYIAAGRKEWLFPERSVTADWKDLRRVLLPPDDELWHFGGEIYAKFENGDVHYQDAYGRTEKEREFLKKSPPAEDLNPKDSCGCGSGIAYRDCCRTRPASLRPSWTEKSIRERNLALHRGILSILGMESGKDWTAVRCDLTEDQIREVYVLNEALWPLETDLLSLLPKPDGRPRAVYTGSLHPQSIAEFALGTSLYFDELIIQSPLVHAGTITEKFRPTENPQNYHLEFLKSVAFLLNMMPLVDAGLINLIPDPWNFDQNLRRETMAMAKARTAGLRISLEDEPRMDELIRLDFLRDVLMWPREAQEARIRENFPDIDDVGLTEMWVELERLKEEDPLSSLQDNIFGGGEGGGQMRLMQMGPNFEIAMYLAQATGASIVTDSAFRWREVLWASRPHLDAPSQRLQSLSAKIADALFFFPGEPHSIVELSRLGMLDGYPSTFAKMFRYLSSIGERGIKPNFEEGLAARFSQIHSRVQKELRKRGEPGNVGKLSCVIPPTGIQDNTINRLLLMSSSEHHLPSVPMAFYIQRASL